MVGIGLNRTTFKFHKMPLGQFQSGISLTNSQVKRNGKVPFGFVSFQLFFFQCIITNRRSISFAQFTIVFGQLNWIELNLNWIEFKLHALPFI
jgi:hypothetical protein